MVQSVYVQLYVCCERTTPENRQNEWHSQFTIFTQSNAENILTLSYQPHEPQMCEHQIQILENQERSIKRHQKMQSNGEMGSRFACTQPNHT